MQININKIIVTHASYIPLFVVLHFLYFVPENKINKNVIISSLGCIVHYPFAYILHIHTTKVNNKMINKSSNITKVNNNINTFSNAFSYKLNIMSIHVHSLLIGYSWYLYYDYIEILYHGFCMLLIIISDPLRYQTQKNTIDVLAGMGIMKSSHSLFYKNNVLWIISIFCCFVSFIMHNKKIFNDIIPIIFYVLLAINQYCILYGNTYY